MSHSTFYTSILIALCIVFLFYIDALDVLERWQFFLLFIGLLFCIQALGDRLFRRYREKRFQPQTTVFLMIGLFAGMMFLGNIIWP